jgi:hypothetical protein
MQSSSTALTGRRGNVCHSVESSDLAPQPLIDRLSLPGKQRFNICYDYFEFSCIQAKGNDFTRQK